jgi:hypothetical protein
MSFVKSIIMHYYIWKNKNNYWSSPIYHSRNKSHRYITNRKYTGHSTLPFVIIIESKASFPYCVCKSVVGCLKLKYAANVLGPLSLVSITELLGRKRRGSRSRMPRLRPLGIRRADYATPFYQQKLSLTSPTSGGRSFRIVRSWTQATGFVFCFVLYVK